MRIDADMVRQEMLNRGMAEEAEACLGDSWSPATWSIRQEADRIVLEAESVEDAADRIETMLNQEVLQGGTV